MTDIVPACAAVKVVAVLAIVVGLVNAVLFALSHLTTAPVCPASVKVAGMVPPIQAVPLLVTVPPTVAGLTTIVAYVELAAAHGLLCTTARM